MAVPISTAKSVCANCGHPESEHGTTGTRPCLATVGRERLFCTCDEFHPNTAQAA